MDEVSYSNYKQYLANGEQVLWQGAPGQGNLVTKENIFLIPFSIFWCGFAIFWETSVIMHGIWPFALFGLFFVFIGLYLVFGRFVYTVWVRKRTYYIITNLKIIRMRNNKVDMMMRANMPPVSLTIHKNGNGTFRIGHTHPYASFTIRFPGMNGQNPSMELENITEPIKVQQILSSDPNQ